MGDAHLGVLFSYQKTDLLLMVFGSQKTLIMVHLHLATGFVRGWFVINQDRDMYNIQQLKHPACYLVVGMVKLNQMLRSEVIKQWE